MKLQEFGGIKESTNKYMEQPKIAINCELFGCSLCVEGTTYDMLVKEDLLLEDGQDHNLLWDLLLMKFYGKEKTSCTIVGVVDNKIFCKWAQEFAVAIVDLESLVVSYYFCFVLYIDILTDF